MIQSLRKHIVLLSILSTIAILVVACANMATPTGGEPEYDPPKVVRTNPKLNATNVSSNKITFEFDENVTVQKPNENVIITPPQQSFPVVQAVNKRVTVQLKDTLIPNTTYVIDFTSAIVDNHESTPLENFAFAFSTGDIIDTLAISGKVLTADNLEPVKGMYVGLHSNMNDTAFTKTKFERISRTNESGGFTIRGVAPGKYRLYALDDRNRDYKYDNPNEAVAFFETIIEPSSERALRMDTTYVEGKEAEHKVIDTVKSVEYTRFLPDNIVLRSFKSPFQRQFLQTHARVQNKLNIFFGAPTQMPKLEPLNFDGDIDWAVLEKTPKNDTLTYWIKDKGVMAIDTLSFRITYLKTDSLNQAVSVTDTLRFMDRSRKKTEKELKKEEEERLKKIEKGEVPETIFMGIKHNLSQSWDTYKNIYLEFDQPLQDSLRQKIRLQQLKDSVYSDIDYRFSVDSVNPRKFVIRHRWTYESEYRLQIDSATVYSIYGLWNDKIDQKFKVKKEDEYGQLAIRVSGVDSIPSFMELLDKSDKPIRKVRVIDNAAVFKDVNPGTYYIRIILDANNNGVWDTGDFDKQLQPELVCYYPGVFEITAFFTFDQTEPWVIDPATLAKQKPLEITKQKPQDTESKRKKTEEQEKRNEQNRQGRGVNSNSNNSRSGNRNNSNNYGGAGQQMNNVRY